jgi:excinuclease ABC subunit A
VRARKGEHVKLLDNARRSGYVRVRADGIIYELSEPIPMEKNKKHTIEIVIDRLTVRAGIEKRLAESIEAAAALTGGLLVINAESPGEEPRDILFSQNFSCPDCNISLEELAPRSFSFNNPAGACPGCTGLGMMRIFDPELIVPNPALSLLEGAVNVPGWKSIGADNSMSHAIFEALSKQYGFDLHDPYSDLPENIKDVLMNGSDKRLNIEYLSYGDKKSYSYNFEGIINNISRRYSETGDFNRRMEFEGYMTEILCPSCQGKRLKPEILAVTVGEQNIADITAMAIREIMDFFRQVKLTDTQQMIAGPILKEIHARTGFLVDVGLDYLTLARSAGTLSGGEAQRIRLATQIGSGLVGVVYILDEPSIGLHQRDNKKLLKTLMYLQDLGNTLIVVEHDEDTMLASDYIVDIGPHAGIHGGEVVFAGKVGNIKRCKASVTGQYLSGKKKIKVPPSRRKPNGKSIAIIGAAENNLKCIDVTLPIGLFTCVTGVSGSGKSSLINEILYKRLARDLNRAKIKPGKHKTLNGLNELDKVIAIDQSPIGRTPRSNPATYTGLFDLIRDVFAQTPEAKVRGYQKGRFSFNVKGGRCEACAGDGILKIEMHFLPDIYVPCEVCHGKRYNRETLEVRYKGKTISDVLDMTIDEALTFFESLPRLREKVQTLADVGLTYIKLGQSSTTLSGGEAQRVKLATELSRRSTGRTLYVLDEPTTGLHSADVHKLISILQRLTENGNTIVVIEHNLDVIKTADYIIDLGPEGGHAGGHVVATGTPEEIAAVKQSYTGQYLRKVLI